MDFFTGFGFAANVTSFASLFRDKLINIDDEWNKFLKIIRKIVSETCKDYREFIESSPDHRDITFFDEYEEIIYHALVVDLEQNTAFKSSSILPMESDFQQGEKERIYTMLQKRLEHSFEWAMRSSAANIIDQLNALQSHAADGTKLLRYLSGTVSEMAKEFHNYVENTPGRVISEENVSEDKSMLPDEDPVKILIDEADKKSSNGDYAGALHIAQQALITAKKSDKNVQASPIRIACAKLACVLKMRHFPEHFHTAATYISDILALGIFDKSPHKMFMLYFNLADISIFNIELSTARAAVEMAYSLAKDDYDIIRCDVISGQISMREGNYDKSIALFQKAIDTLRLKIMTKNYKDDHECRMVKQNLAMTLNSIATAYQSKNSIQRAMVNIEKAVDVAQGEYLELERAISLIHWADMLFNEGLYDSVIEKATEAQNIFKKRNEMNHFVHACEILGAAYYHQEDLVSSREVFFDALNVVDKAKDKLHFSQKIAQLSAELGDERILNEQITLIRKIASFDDDQRISIFEKWAKRLQIICQYALPNNFKDQPGTFFMYDEDDTDFIKLRNELLEIENSSHNVTVYNEKIKNFLMQLSEKAPKQKKNNLRSEEELKELRTKMIESKILSEKAQYMYEIGGWYYDRHEDDEADEWLLRAMNADGASDHTVIWAKITHAQVLMNRGIVEDDEKAKTFLDEVSCLLKASKKYEAIAFYKFNKARLEARKGNFELALDLFKQSYKALYDGKINNPDMIKEIKKKISSVNQCLHFEDNPIEDIPSLHSELLHLQTWYPEYSQLLTEYWWHYRGKEILSNIRISGTSACVIYSDDENEIRWYSEGLKSLFAHILFAPTEDWADAEHCVMRTIPIPCNTPFPYSKFMVNNKKINNKVYGNHFQTDYSERIYAYTRIQDEESFDKNRNPKPITMSFIGYSYPNLVSKIGPMTDEFGSCRWWIGAAFDGSPSALMNLVSRFGVIPVFHSDNINSADKITILRRERIDVPFITDDKNWDERKSIQRKLSRMTSITDQETLFSVFDSIIDQINKLPKIGTPLISIHLSIVRFGYRTWDESPIQWRTYPVVIIYPEDEWRNAEVEAVISKSVTIRDVVYLTQKICAYSHHNFKLDGDYIKADALRLLELSDCLGDKDLAKVAQKVLNDLDEPRERTNKKADHGNSENGSNNRELQ